MKLKSNSKHQLSPVFRATVRAKSGKLSVGEALKLAPELDNVAKVQRQIRKAAKVTK